MTQFKDSPIESQIFDHPYGRLYEISSPMRFANVHEVLSTMDQHWISRPLQYWKSLTGEYDHPPIDMRTFKFLAEPSAYPTLLRISSPILLLHQVYGFQTSIEIGSLVIPRVPFIMYLNPISACCVLERRPD